MQSILGLHPSIAMAPFDRVWWTQVYPRYRRPRLLCNWPAFLRELFGLYQTRVLEVDLERIRKKANTIEEGDFATVFALILTAYAEKEGKPRWGEKTPLLHRYAAEILSAYPQSRFIHILRDPRDTFASMLHARFYPPPVNWLVASASWVALDWLEGVRLATQLEKQYPDQYLVVHYEELVTDPLRVVRHVCDFIQEPFDHSMLDISRYASRIPKSNSSFDDLDDISARPVQRYRQVLSTSQVWIVERLAGRWLSHEGYESSKLTLGPADYLRLVGYEIPSATLQIGVKVGMRLMRRLLPCLAGARPPRSHPTPPHRVR